MLAGLNITLLGQVGVRLCFDAATVYIDPYLSDSVEHAEGRVHRRLRRAPLDPEQVCDADFVLITHEHLDHCDPATLLPIAEASPGARFFGPSPVVDILNCAGIPAGRLKAVALGECLAENGILVHAVPAAHPTIEMLDKVHSRFLGFVLQSGGLTIYHAGDTSVHEEIIAALKRFDGIDLAFIPVNERNFFRDRRGIIGNMSIRDAFDFAAEIGVRTFIPVHWDMFTLNQVFREEIALLYEKLAPPFSLTFDLNMTELSNGR